MTATLMLPLDGLVAPDESDPALVGDSWRTPPELLDAARAFCRLAGLGEQIALDPCTGPGSLVNARVEISLPRDGLSECWRTLADGGLVWCNPPYSDPGPWVRECARVGRHGTHVIALVNAMTSEGWWTWAPRTCFWRGRVRFVSPDGRRHMTNQHPSALCYWGRAPELFAHVCGPFGQVVTV